MRKASVILVVVLLLAECVGQQADHSTVTVAGCVMSVNGTFKLLAHDQTYVLKGHHNELFSYMGKLIEVTGKVNGGNSSSHPGVPVVLNVTKLKKLADSCY
jgi:hypothetical protein